MSNLVTLINYLAKLTKLTKLIIVLVLGIVILASEVKAQQGGTVTYGYDANGRLISVTLPTGESVTYSYDPAGNITSIQRVNGAGPQFLSFAPQSGFVGDTITFSGANFGTVSSVSFSGTFATDFSGNMIQITAKVPSGATTGQITVTLSNGTFTTSTFTVLALQVTPSQVSVLPRQTQQFTAIVPSQLGNNNVTWSVNGVNGGNSSVGTISNTGFYTAPNINNTQNFTIRATSVARSGVFAEANVKVSPDLYQIRASIVVSYRQELLGSQPVAFISVVKGQLAKNLQNYQARAFASVLKGQLSSTSQNTTIYSAPVSITTAPTISSISPSNLARNAVSNITVIGANLTNTTTLVFLNDATGQINTSITISNITVAADGNSLTATVNVGSTSSTGTHRVIISGAVGGHSTTSNVATNIVSITP